MRARCCARTHRRFPAIPNAREDRRSEVSQRRFMAVFHERRCALSVCRGLGGLCRIRVCFGKPGFGLGVIDGLPQRLHVLFVLVGHPSSALPT